MGLGVGDELFKEISDLNRAFAFQAVRLLSLATPVGNPDLWQDPTSAPDGYVGGRARSNWFLDFDNDTETEVDFYGSIINASAQALTATSGKNMTRDFFLHNNLPYISRLNDGWSSQADPGYIDVALDRALRVYR